MMMVAESRSVELISLNYIHMLLICLSGLETVKSPFSEWLRTFVPYYLSAHKQRQSISWKNGRP